MGSDLHTGASPIDAPISTGGAGERPLRRPGARRYALLLATVFTSFAIEGIASPAVWEQVLVTCLLGATLLLALWVVGAKPVLLRAAALAVAAVVVVSVVEAANGTVDGRATRIVNGLLVALAPPAIMIGVVRLVRATQAVTLEAVLDRKSTRLNSSHSQISYAVFCLKKKKKCISHTSNITSE